MVYTSGTTGKPKGASRNFVTRRIAKLPLQFNVNLRAPFFQLITSFKSLYDPEYVRDPRSLGLLDEEGNPIKGIPRHPIVEDDVVVYSGATILGRITVGKGSIIGGNVWITKDVPPSSKIVQTKPRETAFVDGAGI